MALQITPEGGANLAPTAPSAITAEGGANLAPSSPGALVPESRYLPGILVRGILLPDVTGWLPSAGSDGTYPRFSTSGDMTAPVVGVWVSVTRVLTYWVIGRMVDGVADAKSWRSADNVASPHLATNWEAIGGATGIPSIILSGVAPAAPPAITAAGGGNLSPTAPGQIVGGGGKSVSSRLLFAYDAVGFPAGWFQKLGASPLLGEVWAKEDAELSLDAGGLLFGSGAAFVQREVGGFIWSLESSTDWEFNSPNVYMVSANNQPDRNGEPSPGDVEQWLDVINDVDPAAEDDGFTVQLAGPEAPPQITPPSPYL